MIKPNQNVLVSVVFQQRVRTGLRYLSVGRVSSRIDWLLPKRGRLVQRSRLADLVLLCEFDKHMYLTLNTLCSDTSSNTLKPNEAIQRHVDEWLKRFQGSACGSGQWSACDAVTHTYIKARGKGQSFHLIEQLNRNCFF